MVQIQRYITVISPNIFAVSLHPGAVPTPITTPEFAPFAKDTAGLAGGVCVRLASPEADFMDGRYMDVNWDIPELIDRKEEIVSKDLLQLDLKGDFTKGRM
jgi:hypothetical protein